MKRRNPRTSYMGIALVFAFLAFRILFPDQSESIIQSALTSQSESTNQSDLTEEANDVNFQKAYVTNIVDGDTIWVEIDSKRFKVRFIGVNTSEKGEPLYQEATDFTKGTLENKWIYLEKDVSEVDKYNRLLRYIWLDLPIDNSDAEKTEKLFNSKLLLEGLAEIVEYRPDVKYLAYYKRLMHQ